MRGGPRSIFQCWGTLAEDDQEVLGAIRGEAQREQRTIRLIASENFVSSAVLAASTTTLTNKYANGYPGNRRYPGCVWADEVEELAIRRGREVFGADHVNVQPHSGSQANLAAFLAVLAPGQVVLALHPDHGGHFTHGGAGNYSGTFFRFEHFGVERESQLIDMETVYRRAEEVRPQAIVIGSTSYARTFDVEGFARIAGGVGARLIVDAAHTIGLVAGRVHPDPVPAADIVTFTTHKTLRGPRGGAIISKTELADRVDSAVFPMVQGGPDLSGIAAKAVAFREASTNDFRAYAERSVSLALVLARSLMEAGLRVVTGGTDTHIVLVDLTPLGMTGGEAEEALANVGIFANRSRIPFDPAPPGKESGLRFGTAATATLRVRHEEMAHLGAVIASLLRSKGGNEEVWEATSLVDRITTRAVAYPHLDDQPVTVARSDDG